MKLTSLIVDDERSSREMLSSLLEKHCPEIEVAGTAPSISAARNEVGRLHPDVVFLDIEMPNGSGFDFLESIPHRSFFTVFTTAYSNYALRAIKASAIDYLLKPIEPDDLKNAVRRLVSLYRATGLHAGTDTPYKQALETLADNLASEPQVTRLNLPHSRGFKVVDIADIVHLAADSNYTTVHLNNNQKVVVSIPLKEFEEILAGGRFFRTHKSHMINMDYLDEFTTDDGGYAVMRNGARVEISKRKIMEFFQQVDRLHRRVKK